MSVDPTTARSIKDGIAEATYPEGPWEFGEYCERYDGPADGDRSDDSLWIPLIYGEMTETEARQRVSEERMVPEFIRNSRVVRRAVSPWEVQA